MKTPTVYTPDGKLHTLLGSVTLAAIVREYAGEEAAQMVEELEEAADETLARVDTDLDSYEASLEHWQRMGQDWLDTIDGALRRAEASPRSAKKVLTEAMEDLRHRINGEL